MTITVQYVVTHKGEELLTTTSKKEADQYDKMLDIGDNITSMLKAKGIKAEDELLEEIGILLSENKSTLTLLLKGRALSDLAD